MKTIKCSLVVFVIFLINGITFVSAQNYFLDYGPGSIAWGAQMMQRENVIRTQNSMMQMQVLNYYQQQAAAATYHLMNNPYQPMQGVYTYDGVYLTPETVNNYTKEKVACEHCSDGYNYRTIYMGDGETRKVRSRCDYCHGNGYLIKTVKK